MNLNKFDKRLTVVIPGFNTPDEWWRRCLESVLLAIGEDDEVICVDDASNQQSAFLQKLPDIDTRVKVIWRKSNGGLSVARNTALDMAKGAFVTFVDSDDCVNPGVFTRAIAYLQQTNSDIVIYGVKVIWVEDGLMKVDLPDDRNYGILSPNDVLELLRRCLLNYAWNKIYSRSFLEKNAGVSKSPLRFVPEGMPCEDILFNLTCIQASAKWCSIAYPGYTYYRTRNTLLSTYKSSSNKGLQLATIAWKQYKSNVPQAQTVLGNAGEFSELDLLRMEWKNIWMPNSPFSLWARWQWLCAHPKLGGLLTYIRMLLYVILRRWFYFRPVRRWHIRRMFSNIQQLRI